MKRRIALLAAVGALSLLAATPAYPQEQQATDPVDHSAHHPAAPAAQTPTPPAVSGAMDHMTSSAKLGELVKKMNAAEGPAKTETMAELLTALVQDRQACESMMTKMSGMMEMMKSMGGNMPMDKDKKE